VLEPRSADAKFGGAGGGGSIGAAAAAAGGPTSPGSWGGSWASLPAWRTCFAVGIVVVFLSRLRRRGRGLVEEVIFVIFCADAADDHKKKIFLRQVFQVWTRRGTTSSEQLIQLPI